MTVFKFFLVVVYILVMFIGLYLMYRGQKINKNTNDALSNEADGQEEDISAHLSQFAKAEETESNTEEDKNEEDKNLDEDFETVTNDEFDETPNDSITDEVNDELNDQEYNSQYIDNDHTDTYQDDPVDESGAYDDNNVEQPSDVEQSTTDSQDIVSDADTASESDADNTQVNVDAMTTDDGDKNNFTDIYTSADEMVGKDDQLKSNLDIPPVAIRSDVDSDVDFSGVSENLLSSEDESAINAISAMNSKEETKTNNLLNNMLSANSPLFDKHFKSSEKEQHKPLTEAEDNINISILPNNEFSYINGDKLLELVENYGFKFGAMNMFHRYENKDGTGILWFSMMGLTKDGIVPFDITTMADSNDLKGLVMFLPLPHPNVLQGFDSMMSIANMMARQLSSYVVDEEGDPMTNEYKKKLRSLLQTTLTNDDK